MGWYIIIKTIKGHRYRYRQRTWREGKHVRTESVYLGPVDGGGRDRERRSDVVKVAKTEYERTVAEHRANLADAKPRPREPEKPEPSPDYSLYSRDELREVRRAERERAREYEKAMQKEKAKVRAAKRNTKGIKALNPFLARGIKKTDGKN